MTATKNKGSRWLGLLAGCLLALWVGADAATESVYVDDDVEMTGGKMHIFADDEEQVSVFLGAFRMTVGRRVVTGRDAVVWIASRKAGAAKRQDIRVYVEGDARITEPDGATTGDRAMYLTFFTTGSIDALPEQRSEEAMENSPLYRRALAARREVAEQEAKAAAKGAEDEDKPSEEAATAPASRSHVPPELLLRDEPPPQRTTPEPTDAPDEDVELPFVVEEGDTGQPATPDRTPVKAEKPAESIPTPDRVTVTAPAPILPVNFYAENFKSEMRNGRRVTIATGNVYLSQGDPNSENFLELRAHRCVVFSEVLGGEGRRMPVKETLAPGSPQLREGGENVVGVYLEGDVVMARGERFLRGPRAYYDFTTDRAIMTDAVFRTVQEQRNIPVYIRAPEARALSVREMWFKDAKVSTSEFHSPSYHFGARRVYVMDTTAYDEKGVRLSRRRYLTKMKHVTTNIRGVPVLYMPYYTAEGEQGHTALRKAQVGWKSSTGLNVETEWYLFRLLGLVAPKGFDAILHLNYERGPFVGVDLEYARGNYTGYGMIYGLVDQEREDDFGEEREDIAAPEGRGRVLLRHKQFLPRDWQMQFELSYLCDLNYLEQFFPTEFHAGKDQETLLYARKQRDNWAFDVLLKTRINRFLTQTEAAPDVGVRILGESLLGDQLTFYGEGRLGAVRLRHPNYLQATDSDWIGRFDARGELDWPVHVGPFNLVPYVAARGTAWTDEPRGGKNARPYGQVGARLNTHIWRVYNDVENRLLDINRLKHIITPEVEFMLASAGSVSPDDLYALSPDIEENITDLSGVVFGVRQRLQTKRGKPGRQRNVTWMRLDVTAGIFDAEDRFEPSADGRWFSSRPEYSLGRDFIYVDYAWHVSDSTTLLADANWDIGSSSLGRSGVGLAVHRSPRLAYYVGMRTINDLETAIATLIVRYKISRKYSIVFSEQYDFDFNDGTNLLTSVSITRKFPRWYAGLTLGYDRRYNDLTLLLNLWPEGLPEAAIRTQQVSVFNRSEKN